MASRPVVAVFQELAAQSSSPATPELNCLIVGPSYWIQDFPEDRANIQLGTDYGVAADAAATGSAVVTASLTVADVPNNPVGAELDQSSVRAFMGSPKVELAFGSDMTTTVASTTVGSAGVDFVAAGVQALDTLVMTDSSDTLVRTVIAVTASTLVLNSETPAGFDATAVKFRVQRALADTELDASHLTLVPATNAVTVNALATLTVGSAEKRIVASDVYLAYRSFRTDLADVKTIDSASQIVGQLGKVDARNPLAVGVSVALQNTNTSIQYFGISSDDSAGFLACRDAISSRKDIYAVVPLTASAAVLAAFKAEFEGLADPLTALDDGIPQKFRVVIGSVSDLPTTKGVIELNTDGLTEEYAAMAAPTTAHTLTAPGASFITWNVQPGDSFVISADSVSLTAATGTLTFSGNPVDGDTVTIGARTYTFQTVLTEANGNVLIGTLASDSRDNLVAAITLGAGGGTGYALATTANTQVTATPSGGNMTVTALTAGLVGNSIVTTDTSTNLAFGAGTLTGGLGVLRDGTYTVAHVNSATELELSTELPGGDGVTANATITVAGGAPFAVTGLATSLDARLYLDLWDTNGTFIDDAVMPGDFVEMPVNPNGSDFTAKHTFVVEEVLSNQRLRIVDNGRNTALVTTELPHGVTRGSPATLIPATETLRYRITRTVDKDGQILELIAVSQSLASRRVVNVWPNLCDVASLVDGSLTRDPLQPTVALPAAPQPGYYLACAVGGMTAGLPSHQGFTNLGIAGVSKLYNSNTYFSDKNITDLSNGGWFVFQQDTPTALPYIVHQLTTDVTSLETGEFSMVKNFDFVSLFFADILDDYLGQWNVNPETLGFISAAVDSGIDNLKLRRRPRIGAPVIDATLVSIVQNATQSDRVDLVVEVEFPAPLNTVTLRLVSA